LENMTEALAPLDFITSQDDGRQPLLQAKGLRKEFSGTVAVKDVDFILERGETVAVVGENGAGKSTLKNLLVGLLEPDVGTIELEGKRIYHFNAAELGIAAVHQEFSLFGSLSVAENICIVDLPGKRAVVNWKETHQIARKYLDMIGAHLELDTPVEKLSTGEQQLVEIAKALRQATKVLILDEPTASLTEPERDRLFAIVRRLRDSGLGIVFISHFIEEVYEIADKVVVLRDGQYVGGGFVTEFPRARMEELMVGRSIKGNVVEISQPQEKVALRVENIVSEPKVRGMSFELHRGEILGLSGLMGAGRTELVEAIYGLRPSNGKIWLSGKWIEKPTPALMRSLGVAFVPEDRRRNGLFGIRSLRENLTAAAIKQHVERVLPGFGFRKERENAERIAEELKVVHAGIEREVRFLSGGNQQKALLGRWLAIKPHICIFDEPTRGVDIGAKEEIHILIARLARSGVAVLLVSSELPELMMLSHRILILRKGEVVKELQRQEFDPRVIIKNAASATEEEESVWN
jgi:ABC-type sugar transport system ATPase subunit